MFRDSLNPRSDWTIENGKLKIESVKRGTIERGRYLARMGNRGQRMCVDTQRSSANSSIILMLFKFFMVKSISFVSLRLSARKMIFCVPANSQVSPASAGCVLWLRKGFPSRLANSQVSPATAGCLCARNGFIGSAQGCPDCPKWGYREF